MSTLPYILPGLRIKRWLALLILGFIISGLGFSVLFGGSIFGWLEVLFQSYAQSWFGGYGSLVSGLALIILGGAILTLSFHATINALLQSVFPEYKENILKVATHRNYLKRGPRIVVVGGGTGLATMLRGLKKYTSNITAIVSVTDDGGSSGRLRGDFGILPPGDLRNCLVALADTEASMEKLFNYRFSQGQDLAGHSLGNLLITALADISGSFETAINEAGKVLAIRGRVLPSTLDNIVLLAELQDQSMIMGETHISKTKKPIKRVFLQPPKCQPVPAALSAIREADAIILGPGSLYTSIIPNLLVPGISEEIKKANALKIYVCNIMTQSGETPQYTAYDHIKAIYRHSEQGLIEYMLVNNQGIAGVYKQKYASEGAQTVTIDKERIERLQVRLIAVPLIHEKAEFIRHDSDKLAHQIIKLILEKKGTKLFSLPLSRNHA